MMHAGTLSALFSLLLVASLGGEGVAHAKRTKLVAGSNMTRRMDASAKRILKAVEAKLGQEVILEADGFTRMQERTAHIAMEQKHPNFPSVVMVKNSDGSHTPVAYYDIKHLTR